MGTQVRVRHSKGVSDLLTVLSSSKRKIQQGYATLPCVEVRLEEMEMAHSCGACEVFETIAYPVRFERCSRCKKVYYVRILLRLPKQIWLTTFAKAVLIKGPSARPPLVNLKRFNRS